jgi:hypothetical protein
MRGGKKEERILNVKKYLKKLVSQLSWNLHAPFALKSFHTAAIAMLPGSHCWKRIFHANNDGFLKGETPVLQ